MHVRSSWIQWKPHSTEGLGELGDGAFWFHRPRRSTLPTSQIGTLWDSL
jgi:hypothetical protein